MTFPSLHGPLLSKLLIRTLCHKETRGYRIKFRNRINYDRRLRLRSLRKKERLRVKEEARTPLSEGTEETFQKFKSRKHEEKETDLKVITAKTNCQILVYQWHTKYNRWGTTVLVGGSTACQPGSGNALDPKIKPWRIVCKDLLRVSLGYESFIWTVLRLCNKRGGLQEQRDTKYRTNDHDSRWVHLGRSSDS